MAVSVEGYLAVNLLINLLVVGLTARCMGRMRRRRIVTAAVLGCIYALLMETPALHFLRWPVSLIAWGFVEAWVGTGPDSPRQWLTAAGMLAIASLFIGAVQTLFLRADGMTRGAAMGVGAAAGTVFLMMAFAVRARRLTQLEVLIRLTTDYGCASFRALVDTGNRLREPISGQSVVIVEYAQMARALPPDFLQLQQTGAVPPGFRAVGYGALGGGGRLLLIRPRLMRVSYGGAWMNAPELWVGIYPGKMAGDVRALAPYMLGCVRSTDASGSMKRRESGLK